MLDPWRSTAGPQFRHDLPEIVRADPQCQRQMRPLKHLMDDAGEFVFPTVTVRGFIERVDDDQCALPALGGRRVKSIQKRREAITKLPDRGQCRP